MKRARKNRETPLVRRWKVALKNADMTQAEWAQQYGWTESHVGQTVAGKRESSHVIERVSAFIEEQERLIAQRVGSAMSAPNAAA